MFLVVGLGNPGPKYAGTRHNVGFSVITELGDRHSLGFKQEHKAMVAKGVIGGRKAIFAMPQTYMNLSGESVRALMDYYDVTPDELIVVYDDIDLDIGRLRIRQKGSAGGHNGMKNIIAQIGSQEFVRVRVGVGAKPVRMDLADYVLSRFSDEERPALQSSVKLAADCVEMILVDGGDSARAMNQANGAVLG